MLVDASEGRRVTAVPEEMIRGFPDPTDFLLLSFALYDSPHLLSSASQAFPSGCWSLVPRALRICVPGRRAPFYANSPPNSVSSAPSHNSVAQGLGLSEQMLGCSNF